MRFFYFCISSLLFAVFSYDQSKAEIGTWLCGAAYCNKENYTKMNIDGPATGFKIEDILYDSKTDLQGYTGIMPSKQTIYLVFRGSASITNWEDDVEILLVPYKKCKGCYVHYGFYQTALNLVNQTHESLIRLKNKYPTYETIVTGHSLAASVSLLISLELQSLNIKTSLYNYGQPRTGNDKFAQYVNKNLKDYWRFTHNRDIFVHLPPQEFDYKHSCGEIYQNATNYLHICSMVNCEDPNCSNSVNIFELNATDHLYYLGHHLTCTSSIK
jgi:hypothetical protein